MLGYTNAGAEYVEFIAYFDNRTSQICMELDGAIIPLNIAAAGVNIPPMHPNCRSCISAYFGAARPDESRKATDAEGNELYLSEGEHIKDRLAKMSESELKSFEMEQKQALRAAADHDQYERYKKTLGPDAPSSFEKFRDIKYNNPEAYDKLKTEYHFSNVLAQSPGSSSIPAEYVNNFSGMKPLNLSDEDKARLIRLREITNRDNKEHGVAYINGSPRPLIGHKDNITIPDRTARAMDKAAKGTVKIYHSHTNDNLPSWLDFGQLCRESHDTSYVITNSNYVFSFKVGNGKIPEPKKYFKTADEIKKQVKESLPNMPGFNKWTQSECEYVKSREIALRITNHYNWELGGGKL